MKHFTVAELTASAKAAARGMANTPPPEVVARLEALVLNVLDPAREQLGSPIRVNSGYRSERVNRLVGGARGSQHIRGEAADITSADNPRLLEILRRLPYDQLIAYIDRRGLISWLHVSFREGQNRGQEMVKYI